tara:strand:- start:1062 stop:1637 length:576 start_codon:yes stop_codon:yes gene_type:complete
MMIKQNVNIVNYNSLYEILDEIKENLSFNIKKYETIEEFTKDNQIEIHESLIILNEHNKTLNPKGLLIFKNLPLTLNKLIELINVQLIKLKFNQQSKISIKKYVLNLNSKFFTNNSVNLKLTEKEVEIILYLNSTKKKHNILDLQKNIWGYSSELETHTVETHIYRLRKKISDKFNDDNFILSHNDGYFIE